MSSSKNSNNAADNPQSGQGRPLPKKEADQFKNVIKFYESKNYKKALKNADLILKRYPNHGETLCMKGLIVNGMVNSGIGVDAMKGDKNKKKVSGGEGEDEKISLEEKKKEAIELVKRGLMNDMRSHVCWHVYGLLHRSSQNYKEAIKAYKQALRIDVDNLQILRDMGLLQIQMRDISGFQETRLKILTLRPNQKIHWLTYALSLHVGGNPEGAVGIINSYMDTLDEQTSPDEFTRNFENSELAMYKNLCLSETKNGIVHDVDEGVEGEDKKKEEEGGEQKGSNSDNNNNNEDGKEEEGVDDNDDDGLGGIRAALKHLDEIHKIVVDETGWLMAKLSYQLQLGQFDNAKETVSTLFERGLTEDHRVHGAYMCALLSCDRDTCCEVERLRGTATLASLRPLSDDERSTLLAVYGEEGGLAIKYPRSAAIKRIRLILLPHTGEEFKSAIGAYCQRQIIKGVPSLGSDLSSMYLMEEVKPDGQTRYKLAKDPVDVKAHPIHGILVELVDSYIVSLSSSNNTFPNDTTKTEHPPSVLLWTWYLRSVLHEQVGEYANGISLINKCIDHTPTAVDFYELKSRLLELGGDIQEAANVVDAGRDLDHQDRYINNQTTKLLLRAGRMEDAGDRIALFTREGGPPEQNLYDMQCTWYELEVADCLRKKGELGKSLRKYMAVIKHFEDIYDDQFDFHMYCVRKVTLRSYCKLLKFEDDLWGLPHYGRAAEEVIKIHLHLLDNPADSQADAEPDYSKMTPAERKKAKNIARKKKKALEAKAAGGGGKKDEANGGKDKPANSGNKKKPKPHVIDQDPEGKELLALDHLEEANKYASLLVLHAPKRMSAWALHYDVSVRRGEMSLALEALSKMKSVGPDSHKLFSRIVDFSQRLSNKSAGEDGAAASEEVISDFSKLMDGKSLSDFVNLSMDGVKNNPLSTLSMKVAVAKAVLSTNVGSSADAASLVLDSKLNVRGVTVESCQEAVAFMDSLDKAGKGGSNKERMMKLIMAKFTFAKDF